MQSIRNIFICIFIAITGMILTGFSSAYITKEVINSRSFESRTASEFLELSNLKRGEYKELLYLKSVFLFGSIMNMPKQGFYFDKTVCTEINDDMRKLILDAIEERVIIPYKEKDMI